MTHVLEIAAWGGPPATITPLSPLASVIAGLAFLDHYRALPPDPASEEPGPGAILHLGFAAAAAARAFSTTAALQEIAGTILADAARKPPPSQGGGDGLGRPAASGSSGPPPESPPARLTATLFRRHDFPVAGRIAPLGAPFSYVVRYRLPANDPENFRAYYLRMHPPILARFPSIRNVLCYTPLAAPECALPTPGWLIGNEVVFDDEAAFKVAMASPVREEARADGRTFPPYSGRNHHWPMSRARLWSNGTP